MRNICFIFLPHIMASSLTLPLEMLNAAENIARSENRRRPGLQLQIAAPDLKPMPTSGGLLVQPTQIYRHIEQADLVFIPALWRNPMHTLKQNPALCDWLRLMQQNGSKICAVGTGSTFLAEAGLLNGKPATTHWFYFNLMESTYPDVEWKRQHLITQADNLYCAGSINSVADLTVHLIDEAFGPRIARRVESQFSPEIRRAYDSHLFDTSPDTRHQDELVAGVQAYIRNHFADEINFCWLAGHNGIASRSLQRRFKRATNYSPLQYQQYLRVQNARELLQNTNLNIQEVAELVGYVDASHFSQVFKKHTEQTPKDYRHAVRGKLFTA